MMEISLFHYLDTFVLTVLAIAIRNYFAHLLFSKVMNKIVIVVGGILFVGLLASTITFAVLWAEEVDSKGDLPSTSTTVKPTEPFQYKDRINCFPEKEPGFSFPTQSDCETRGCTWDNNFLGESGIKCYMHPNEIGYKVVTQQEAGDEFILKLQLQPLNDATIFDPPMANVYFTAKQLTENHIQIKIVDGDNSRFEVPFEPPTDFKEGKVDTSKFTISYEMNPFSFQVKSDQKVLFDSSLGGFVMSNRFLQISTKVTSGHFVYGLGEHEHPTLAHSFQYKTWPMFARDQPGLGEVSLFKPVFTAVK